MSVITTGTHPKAHWPGVKNWWGENYARHDKIWPKLFTSETSTQEYEETVEETGFGLMQIKPQGGGITYDTTAQGYVTRFTHITYATGYIVTQEEVEDNLYEKLSYRRAGRLANSAAETEEIVHANVFNRGFNSSYAGGDGVSLFSTAHPCQNGNQSNRLTVDADMSEASIEDMIILTKNATNSKGLRMKLLPRALCFGPSNSFEAHRIVKSVLQNDTSNNAVNVLRDAGHFPDGFIENPYFEDTDAWFIKTNCNDGGMYHFTRKAIVFDQDNDFDTKNLKASAIARWSQGWDNWRCYYGSQGG